MIIWGGLVGSGGDAAADGAAYDPSADSWTLLPESALGGRSDHVAVWTGAEMLVWGGVDSKGMAMRDGAAYDPVSTTWRTITPAPPGAPRYAVGGWSGDELIVWGVDNADQTVGAAYNPVSDAWRNLGRAPIEGRDGATAVWSGNELIIWGGVAFGGTAGWIDDGVAYNGAESTWRNVPAAPIKARWGHAAIWTGTVMMVWGGSQGDSYALSDGAEFDPADPLAASWAPLPPAPLVGRFGHSAVWTGAEMLIWGGRNGFDLAPLTRGVAYNPRDDAWRGQTDLPTP
jgi:hypothetical protein